MEVRITELLEEMKQAIDKAATTGDKLIREQSASGQRKKQLTIF